MRFPKKYLYIAIAVLIFLIALGWYFYRQGKKKVTLQYNPYELPGNPQSGQQIGASNDEIKRIANELYGDMQGANILGHNYAPYNAAILLNDGDIIKLYNAFNSQYQEKSGETLTQWLSGEWFADVDAPATLYARLKKLNCN